MSFFGEKKQSARTGVTSSAAWQNESESAADLKSVTESLYKQNHELSVKNKTLSLLRGLYQISILGFAPDQLSKKIVKTVRDSLELELVGIFSYKPEKDELLPLGFDSSDRMSELYDTYGMFPKTIITRASNNPFFAPIVGKKILHNTIGPVNVWDEEKGRKDEYEEFTKDSHIKTTIGYPLVIDDEVTGVLIICLNREYESMLPYEKESIASLVDVTAIALNKAVLYQELEAANTKFSLANARLKELDQTKSEFISLATHQIRSPLTAIKGYTSMILDGDYGKITPQLQSVIKIIFDSCENLVVIVGEFLDISRIEQGRMKYERAIFNFKDLVQETIQSLIPIVEQAGLGLEFQHPDGQNYDVNADRGKMKQIISNLIDNSIKYTIAGGITVRVENIGNKVLLSIKDTGVGIDQSEKEKLFQKFIRAKDADRTNVIGTGLGLYIAKQMVEAQGGRVWAESEGRGMGSTFYVELDEYKS